ncbi:uncharacterized protein Tco025E_00140 [Trypanosoma conorhini]|uniref:Uncharacterized protein n=1 Tax=Trypanosoma conorhini TaxID=83891 RepID=A0A3R7SBE0_9TRYP|nr:uncharacterized protein Tco025E_00140 [Trypanosoma conorhini]RNF27579.1 hypothetical protein Tco025E_00140 [Trypanosoma conorhini]
MGSVAGKLSSCFRVSRWRVLELVILAAVIVASSMLILFLPASRVYCGIALVVAIICGLRLWRFLPSDRRRVSKEAHRLADAMLLARQAAVGAPLAAQSVRPAVPQAAPEHSPVIAFTQDAPSPEPQLAYAATAPAQQLVSAPVAPLHPPRQSLLLNSVLLPQQQAVMTSAFSPQHALMASSMALPYLQQQQQHALLAGSMAPTSQMFLASPQASPAPKGSLPKGQPVGDAGNVLPQHLLASRGLARFG